MSNFGLEYDLVDLTDIDALKDKIKASTKAIYFETPSNPLMTVLDIQKLADIVKENSLLTIVDNTFATPYFQRPLSLGQILSCIRVRSILVDIPMLFLDLSPQIKKN